MQKVLARGQAIGTLGASIYKSLQTLAASRFSPSCAALAACLSVIGTCLALKFWRDLNQIQQLGEPCPHCGLKKHARFSGATKVFAGQIRPGVIR